jgi:hypothetical protein
LIQIKDVAQGSNDGNDMKRLVMLEPRRKRALGDTSAIWALASLAQLMEARTNLDLALITVARTPFGLSTCSRLDKDHQKVAAAFEVKHLTSSYSGIVRMLDLARSANDLHASAGLYLVAPDARESDVSATATTGL